LFSSLAQPILLSKNLGSLYNDPREIEDGMDRLGHSVEKVFLADLDGNGFDEIYLLTRRAGSGSYSSMYGVASNKDKSATLIYVPEISEKQMGRGGLFEGFMGHNKFSVEDGKLINTFPVYLENDSNTNPTGGKRKVLYQLILGEAGWILKPDKICM